MIVDGLYGARLHYEKGDIEFHLEVYDGQTHANVFFKGNFCDRK